MYVKATHTAVSSATRSVGANAVTRAQSTLPIHSRKVMGSLPVDFVVCRYRRRAAHHVQVNDFYQSSNPRVYGCGDVIGYPALASTSMEQVRFSNASESVVLRRQYGVICHDHLGTSRGCILDGRRAPVGSKKTGYYGEARLNPKTLTLVSCIFSRNNTYR